MTCGFFFLRSKAPSRSNHTKTCKQLEADSIISRGAPLNSVPQPTWSWLKVLSKPSRKVFHYLYTPKPSQGTVTIWPMISLSPTSPTGNGRRVVICHLCCSRKLAYPAIASWPSGKTQPSLFAIAALLHHTSGPRDIPSRIDSGRNVKSQAMSDKTYLCTGSVPVQPHFLSGVDLSV